MISDVSMTGNGNKKLTSCVREVLDNHTGEFKLKDVLLLVSEIYQDEIKHPTLSKILKRMSNDGKIEIVETGTGSRPTVYSKKAI